MSVLERKCCSGRNQVLANDLAAALQHEPFLVGQPSEVDRMALAAAPTAGPSHGGLALTVSSAGGYDGTNQYEENAEHLRQLFSQSKLVSFSIAHIACSAGSSSGDNYMSVVKRVTISQAGKEQDPELAGSEIGKVVQKHLSPLH